jgi:RNA-binding protein
MAGPLTGAQRKWLRGQAHGLDPVVRLGKNGLTDSVLREIDAALEVHELIKIQAPGAKEEKREVAREIEERLKATEVGTIGHVLILFRRNPDPERRVVELPG